VGLIVGLDAWGKPRPHGDHNRELIIKLSKCIYFRFL